MIGIIFLALGVEEAIPSDPVHLKVEGIEWTDNKGPNIFLSYSGVEKG